MADAWILDSRWFVKNVRQGFLDQGFFWLGQTILGFQGRLLSSIQHADFNGLDKFGGHTMY